MGGTDPEKPSEWRGGAPTGDQEAREKGHWADQARQGVVPAELGGSDAPPELLSEDPELSAAATGGPARSDAPATESGIDLTAGDRADATTDGGPEIPAGGAPDLKDAASGPRRVDIESAG